MIVWFGPGEGLACLDHTGRELWQRTGNHNTGVGLRDDVIYSVVTGEKAGETHHFSIVDRETGEEKSRQQTVFGMDALLIEPLRFIGIEITHEGSERIRRLARIDITDNGLTVRWCVESRGPTTALKIDVFDYDLAVADGRVFIGRGDKLLALDLETGKELWAADLAEVGGPAWPGKWVPMVENRRVNINTSSGNATYDASSGKLLWSIPHFVARTIYSDRLYSIEGGNRYRVIEMRTGQILTDVSLAKTVKLKWRFRNVVMSTDIGVSETHMFCGDREGRIYAFERSTGEPMWYHHPEDTPGFSGGLPVIAGNRLYIPALSLNARVPSRLYCYEQA